LEHYLVTGWPVSTGLVIVYEQVNINLYNIVDLEASEAYTFEVLPVYTTGLGSSDSITFSTL
jgi:hypothetical protein